AREPGIVHEHVDAPETLDRPPCKLDRIRSLAQIGHPRGADTPCLLDLRHHLIEWRLAPTPDHHPRPLRGQHQRGRPPNPRPAARDDRDLPLEHLHRSPLSVPKTSAPAREYSTGIPRTCADAPSPSRRRGAYRSEFPRSPSEEPG